MPICNKLVDLNAIEQGAPLEIGSMKFFVKRTNENVANKINQIRSDQRMSIADKTRAISKIVFKDLVTGWEGVTTTKLQAWIVSSDFYKDEEWCPVDDINFLVKRVSLKNVSDFSKTTNDKATVKKFVDNCVLDWENFRLDYDTPEIPYSKAEASKQLSKPEVEIVVKELQSFGYNENNYALDIKDEEVKFNDFSINRYMIEVDRNELIDKIASFAADVESFRSEQIAEDEEALKK